MGQRNPPLPISFRSELLEQVMPSLHEGECCSLIGISGVGKSNLAQFVRQRDLQSHYWNDDKTWLILVDSNSLVFGEFPNEYVVGELMIHRLIMEAEARDESSDFVRWANDLHIQLRLGQVANLHSDSWIVSVPDYATNTVCNSFSSLTSLKISGER